MKKILISSFDLEIGGVERSLISLLEKFDYENNQVDLMLYSHTGDFMKLLPKKPNLLPEDENYKTIRQGIAGVLKRNPRIGFSRLKAKIIEKTLGKYKGLTDGCYQLQLMCKYTSRFLPGIKKEYDVAISYLWPHYFTLDRVKARKKIGWIHTDYSMVETDVKMDLRMWKKLDHIVGVSEECVNSFLKKYPSLKEKVSVIENITAPEFIRKMSEEETGDIFLKECFNILSVARFSHAKGIDNAVRALKILKDRGYGKIKWFAIGYGGDEAAIRSLIRENNLEENFIILGKKANPYPYMKKCDLYVQPSRYEGKAVTVSEAQILGKAVMITDYPTAKSQIDNGRNGYICSLSVKGIAEGIEKLYKDHELRENLEKNCKDTDFCNREELRKLYRLFEES